MVRRRRIGFGFGEDSDLPVTSSSVGRLLVSVLCRLRAIIVIVLKLAIDEYEMNDRVGSLSRTLWLPENWYSFHRMHQRISTQRTPEKNESVRSRFNYLVMYDKDTSKSSVTCNTVSDSSA